MIIGNILSELCVPSGFSFGTNAIVLAFIQHAVVRVVPLTQQRLTFCSNYISSAEITNGEKHLGPLRNQMKREPKRLLVKFFRSFTTEVIKNMLAFHFVRWLIRHRTRESKISGGGGGFVRFSYFMYLTCCRFHLFETFMPCLRWFLIACEWLQMFLRWLQVVVEIFEVVVDGCRWFQAVLGGFRSLHVLVLTSRILNAPTCQSRQKKIKCQIT